MLKLLENASYQKAETEDLLERIRQTLDRLRTDLIATTNPGSVDVERKRQDIALGVESIHKLHLLVRAYIEVHSKPRAS